MGRRRIVEREDPPVVTRPTRSGFAAPPGWEVRLVRGDRALKPYRCPGCEQVIPAGLAHVVAVPLDDPEQRRHWHRPCFERFAPRS
jgi:hypothetical protein